MTTQEVQMTPQDTDTDWARKKLLTIVDNYIEDVWRISKAVRGQLKESDRARRELLKVERNRIAKLFGLEETE